MKTGNTFKDKISLRETKVLFHIEHLLRYSSTEAKCPTNGKVP